MNRLNALKVALMASAIAVPSLAYAAGTESGMEEITVTATRRAENLQKLPITVQAMGAAAIEKAQIQSPQDVAQFTPGLNMDRQSAQLKPWIRGVGTQDTSAGQDQSVAIYIDGVYQTSTYFSNNDFNNVERIEVLKGPQGTLFGRNATGGALQIITKDPSHTTGVNGSVGYGNFNTVDGKVYATTGITEDLAADVAISYHKQFDGWGKGLYGYVGQPLKQEDTYKNENISARTKWLYTPSDNTKITMAVDYTHLINDGADARQIVAGTHPLDGSSNPPGFWTPATTGYFPKTSGVTYGIMGKIDHTFDSVELVSITGYRKSHAQQWLDNDGTRSNVVNAYIGVKYKTFTQEIQALSTPDSPYKWIVGAYFMKDTQGFGGKTGITGLTGLGLTGSGVAGGAVGVGINNLITTKAYSVFAETTVPLGETTNITAGVRWSRDERHLNGYTQLFTTNYVTRLNPTAGPTNLGNVAFSKPTWRGILDHQFSDGVMGYASVSRGFKSGNYNAISGNSFQPEILTAYEIGVKSEFLENRVRLNVSAYYYDYKGIQTSAYQGPTIITKNAAAAENAGLEAMLDTQITDQFSVTVGAAYMYSKFKDFKTAVCYIPNTMVAGMPNGGNGDTTQNCDLSGTRLPNTPKFTINISPTYVFPTSVGDITASGNFYHNSGHLQIPGIFSRQHEYNRFDAKLRWDSVDGHYGLSLWGKNLSNEKYLVYATGGANGDFQMPAAPRTYGVEANFKF